MKWALFYTGHNNSYPQKGTVILVSASEIEVVRHYMRWILGVISMPYAVMMPVSSLPLQPNEAGIAGPRIYYCDRANEAYILSCKLFGKPPDHVYASDQELTQENEMEKQIIEAIVALAA